MCFFIDPRETHSVEDTCMDIEEQEQKFRQLLDHLSHSTTQLTDTLVCNVTERSPQLYVKTNLRLLNCIGSLTRAVVKVQQAWNGLTFFRQNVGVPSTEELAKPLLGQEEPKKKVSKRRKVPTADRRRSPHTPSKREHTTYSHQDLHAFGRMDGRVGPSVVPVTDTK